MRDLPSQRGAAETAAAAALRVPPGAPHARRLGVSLGPGAGRAARLARAAAARLISGPHVARLAAGILVSRPASFRQRRWQDGSEGQDLARPEKPRGRRRASGTCSASSRTRSCARACSALRRGAQRLRAHEQRQARRRMRCSRTASSSGSSIDAASALRDASTRCASRRRSRAVAARPARAAAARSSAACSALALSEGLRSKVLDMLFGAEEEFDYSSTTAPADARTRGRRRQLSPAAAAEGDATVDATVLETGLASGEADSDGQREAVRPAARCRARRPSGSSSDAPQRRPARHRPVRRSTTSRARRASRAGCCTTTSAPRSSCSSRRSAATASCALERLERQLSTAQTAEDFIDLMAQSLHETLHEDPDFVTLVFELFTLSRRNADIAVGVRRADAPHARAGRGHARGGRARGRAARCTRSRRPSPRFCSRSATESRCACSASPSATSRARCSGHPLRARPAHRLTLHIIGSQCRSTSTGARTGRRSSCSSPSATTR